MSKISMHAASAPAFTRILGNLSAMLDKADAHAKAKNFDIGVLLQARLAPDMFALMKQVQIAADFAKNAAGRLAGQTPPAYADDETTLAQVQARLARLYCQRVGRPGSLTHPAPVSKPCRCL